MYLGCQYSLYPMTSDFVAVILDAVKPLQRYKDRLDIETDDVSTTLIGGAHVLFPALLESFSAAARVPGHLVMNLSLSRGCPGEPDDPRCALPARPDPASETKVALAGPRRSPIGIAASAQIALYPLGRPEYMDDIVACIGAAKSAGTFAKGKHFCTKLAGDVADVFDTIERSFLDFSPGNSHVVLTAIVSKGSPTQAR
ncbi:MAG: HMP/thiamine-binding protein [Alphaproteobacteria bacterium]|nr:HMP/thiamine-binding protein [Alphaproteobacteria bacterium]